MQVISMRSAKGDSGLQTASSTANAGNVTVSWRRKDKMVWLYVSVLAMPNAPTVVLTLPSGARPPVAMIKQVPNGTNFMTLAVDTNGNVTVSGGTALAVYSDTWEFMA